MSKAEQLRRFKARDEDPLKRFKVDPEDWTNRTFYDAYQAAAAEMIQRTNAPRARWHVVPADDKKSARLHVLRVVCETIEAALGALRSRKRIWGVLAMRRMLMSLTALGSLVALDAAQALEIRFYPAKKVRAYELDAVAGVRSVVLQNMAIINDGEANVTVSQVVLEVTERGVAHGDRAAAHRRAGSHGGGERAAAELGHARARWRSSSAGRRYCRRTHRSPATRVLKPGTALLVIAAGPRVQRQARWHPCQRADASRNEQRRLSVISTMPSHTAFALPLDGMWYDGAGPSLHTHHRWAVPQEFAHDFMRIGANGLSYTGEGTSFTDYYAYGQPVLAAADGQVVAVLDDEPEDVTLLQQAGEPLRGLRAAHRRATESAAERAARAASSGITSSSGTATSTRSTRT